MTALTGLVVEKNVLALVGSTERRGTHLMETMAARLHVPLITLCGDDPTIHAVPLPWVFSIAPAERITDAAFADRFEKRFGAEATVEAAMGYDAGRLLARALRIGRPTRMGLQQRLSETDCDPCASGSFGFDALGRRVDRMNTAQRNAYVKKTASK